MAENKIWRKIKREDIMENYYSLKLLEWIVTLKRNLIDWKLRATLIHDSHNFYFLEWDSTPKNLGSNY